MMDWTTSPRSWGDKGSRIEGEEGVEGGIVEGNRKKESL